MDHQMGQSFLLLRRAVDELNTLLDVALESVDGCLQKRLLLAGQLAEHVMCLLSSVGLNIGKYCARVSFLSRIIGFVKTRETYTELDGNREKVATGLLGNCLATGDTGEIDIAGLNETLGTLDGLEQLLGKSIGSICQIIQAFQPQLTRSYR